MLPRPWSVCKRCCTPLPRLWPWYSEAPTLRTEEEVAAGLEADRAELVAKPRLRLRLRVRRHTRRSGGRQRGPTREERASTWQSARARFDARAAVPALLTDPRAPLLDGSAISDAISGSSGDVDSAAGKLNAEVVSKACCIGAAFEGQWDMEMLNTTGEAVAERCARQVYGPILAKAKALFKALKRSPKSASGRTPTPAEDGGKSDDGWCMRRYMLHVARIHIYAYTLHMIFGWSRHLDPTHSTQQKALAALLRLSSTCSNFKAL